ncbi:uncharacterized protein LOC62_02G002653 [Vanrija pseudolonga]|uniref:Extracellular membrane protein CFEM domain-containing protein n=1 Tax=Vanrija pseudolonga TaxID=143232 RepID=A0AAF0Y314_9TREE|nr:hypothetical protein LOC62_02G002653 [Vanrija pseudolonga]
MLAAALLLTAVAGTAAQTTSMAPQDMSAIGKCWGFCQNVLNNDNGIEQCLPNATAPLKQCVDCLGAIPNIDPKLYGPFQQVLQQCENDGGSGHGGGIGAEQGTPSASTPTVYISTSVTPNNPLTGAVAPISSSSGFITGSTGSAAPATTSTTKE